MIHLRKYESFYDNTPILDMRDMSVDLIDMGWYIEIFKEDNSIFSNIGYIDGKDNIRLFITKDGNFTMKEELKGFLFRIVNYMKDSGYEISNSNSNRGSLHFTKDDRIIITGGEARQNYPSFTMISILFSK